MYQEILNKVLLLLDTLDEPVITWDEVNQWPEGMLEFMIDSGFLQETSPAKSKVCDGCGMHCLKEVEIIDRGDHTTGYIICDQNDDIGRVPASPEQQRRWGMKPQSIASSIANILDLSGPIVELEPGRLYWLGSSVMDKRRVDIFFARGLQWSDADSIFNNPARLVDCSLPLIIVPFYSIDKSPISIGQNILTLPRLLKLEDRRVSIDKSEIDAFLRKRKMKRTQLVVPFKTPKGSTWEKLTIEFLSDEAVEITYGDKTEARGFEEMGMANEKTNPKQPNMNWEMLKLLAKDHGRLEWPDNTPVSQRRQNPKKKRISILRGQLQNIFSNLPGDPFKPYKKAKAFETRFILRWKGE